MTDTIIEIKHVPIEEGKKKATEAITQFSIPAWKAKLIQNRWRAVKIGENKPLPQREWWIKETLAAIASRHVIGDQRDVYYALRSANPSVKIEIGGKKYDWREVKVYHLFLNEIMEKAQLATGVTMQSMGIRAGPRGFIFSQDGELYVPRKGIYYSLNNSPALYFDLAEDNATYYGYSRKVIHFEKAAGFEGLTEGNISKMVEAIFSTSQGQLTEAAHKFLAERERNGMKVYSIHDADAFGVQMMMLYGLSSKNNAYMPSSFYAKQVLPLGLLPKVAKELNLESEKVEGQGLVVAEKNLPDMLKLRPEFKDDVEVLRTEKKQWEFQALSGIHESAPQIYIVESLRARGDEIKYVPAEPKPDVVKEIKKKVEEFVNNQIDRYAERFFEDQLKPELIRQLTEKLKNDIEAYKTQSESEVKKIENSSNRDIREAIKMKLVENPVQYYTNAITKVINDILAQKFDIEADIEWKIDVKQTKADANITITPPPSPAKDLTKDDITEAIEKRIIGQAPSRNKVVGRIRSALEKVFGVPDLTW